MPLTEQWYPEPQLRTLAALCQSTALLTGMVIEVGSWQGRSTIALAHAAHPDDVHAVDHWRGDIDNPRNQTEGISPQYAARRDVYAEFCENIQTLTHGNVVVHRQSWQEFVAGLTDERFRFVHLDGAHDYESVARNIEAFKPHMMSGAIMAGDDYLTPSVQQAVRDTLGSPAIQGNLWWRRC